MINRKRYEIMYYYTFEEVCNEFPPYNNSINWVELFEDFLPNAPLYKTVGGDTVLKDYLNDLLEQVYSRYRKHYIYWCKKDELEEGDYFEISLKLANIIINTYDRYAPLYKNYKDRENSLMSMIQSETNANIRYNDTPQNGGDFTDDSHTSNFTGSHTTNTTEGDTPINRLNEIKDKLVSILFEWSEEFDKIFLEEGNI